MAVEYTKCHSTLNQCFTLGFRKTFRSFTDEVSSVQRCFHTSDCVRIGETDVTQSQTMPFRCYLQNQTGLLTT